MVKEMCAAYAAANPQNTYKFLFGVQGESDAADKVLNDVTSGPDVFSFASDQINKLYTGGALARLGGSIEAEVKANNTADSVDAATLTVGGTDMLYAYPMTGDNNFYVYYDKRVYTDDSQLATLDNMIATAKAADKNVHFALTNGWYLSSFFFANPELGYTVHYDDNLVETGVDVNYNNADGLKVAQSIRDYYYDSEGAFVIKTDDAQITAGFTDGSTAAAVSGIWNLKTFQGLLGENLGVRILPTANIGGEQVQLSGFTGYKLIGVNNYSQNKGEAHKLALWLTNEQNQIKRHEVRGFGPTNKNAIATPAVQNDPVISVILQQAALNRPQKGVPSNYWTPMEALFTPFLSETKEEQTDAKLQAMLDACVKGIKRE
jgi:arabinogalactan oligomer/maltooligosaccharide transport system substrate-binding protein